ncbi:hypothetical protein NPIL_607751 [Nephila pilipes]|uniref:Uncharacterized protein n=1 Tax=Nephila pilipes TaxID=299642 RepID=A0A8X6UAA1_NEPPI|nr:hypothetical protein NPIL_607751 [Nephila pilipes]
MAIVHIVGDDVSIGELHDIALALKYSLLLFWNSEAELSCMESMGPLGQRQAVWVSPLPWKCEDRIDYRGLTDKKFFSNRPPPETHHGHR